ncbi:hypothetical protein SAMN04488523_10990 [Sulfitobacter brevis]|uniref:Uncharacterized protein n=1 Tax=Sulfitobacter brevis TaxID=74348 RepID=A0A1I2CDN6_9RHOB|nr:hypothetical protein [Sulfitobacter brevis]SFE66421.1 hypothetical protein SAMN04488523_10990 [Sulfitobacter brevis]
MDEGENLYSGGFASLLKRQEKRQRRFDGVDNILPLEDTDLAALFEAVTPPPAQHYEDAPRYSAQRKWLELQVEFAGQPKILHLHAMLIAISRRDDPPPCADALFFRIWRDHGNRLVPLLTPRWMISTATTFSDRGETGAQRALGMGLSVLFDMIKLHDSERRRSGQPGRSPFRTMAKRKTFPLPFGMDAYGFRGGDLDKILLARLWQLAESDAIIRPLGFAMLRLVMSDQRSIFARIQAIKAKLKGDG